MYRLRRRECRDHENHSSRRFGDRGRTRNGRGALGFVLSRSTEERDHVSTKQTDRSTSRDDDQGDEPVPEVAQELRLVGIVPSPRIVRLDGPGETERLTVQGYYSDRSMGDLDDGQGAPVSYSSSDPSVAEVDSRGAVTSVEVGGADITVTYKDLTATVPVFVWGSMQAVPPIDRSAYWRLMATGLPSC